LGLENDKVTFAFEEESKLPKNQKASDTINPDATENRGPEKKRSRTSTSKKTS
jgi:hypothetical protein